MKAKQKQQFRQGDVFIEQVDKIPEGLTQVKPDAGRCVLAYGEATGHAHAIPASAGKLYRGKDARALTSYLRVTKATALVHDEHAPIALAKGNYAVTAQREYDAEEIRRVAD